MSTKITISHGKDFHFYKECFHEKAVYLELSDSEFCVESNQSRPEGSKTTVKVSIPLHAFLEIVKAWEDHKFMFEDLNNRN